MHQEPYPWAGNEMALAQHHNFIFLYCHQESSVLIVTNDIDCVCMFHPL